MIDVTFASCGSSNITLAQWYPFLPIRHIARMRQTHNQERPNDSSSPPIKASLCGAQQMSLRNSFDVSQVAVWSRPLQSLSTQRDEMWDMACDFLVTESATTKCTQVTHSDWCPRVRLPFPLVLCSLFNDGSIGQKTC